MIERATQTCIEQEQKLELGKRIVTLIGPEGSGKTTIAKLIVEESDKPHITVSAILRDLAANDTTVFGDECRAMFSEHRYMNPDILLAILQNRFSQDDLQDGFIMDGGMRTLGETQGMPDVFKNAGQEMPVTVVHLRIPGWMSVQRLITGETARKRDDDTADAVLSRLSNYYTNLGKRAAFIHRQENWELIHADATGTVEDTFRNVKNAFANQSVF